MDKYKFGNRLYELRKANNITQEKLGKMLGVSNKAISKWENGESYPRLPMLDKIAECFNMSVEELLEYGETNKSKALDELNEKELNTEVVREVRSLPKATFKMIKSFGLIKIDAQEFIREVKEERSLTNKDLATIFATSEKMIGLWENGLKQPSFSESSAIAAFYYNNCDKEKKVNLFLDTTFYYAFFNKATTLFIAILYFALILFMIPPLVDDEAFYEMYAFGHLASFRYQGLFVLVLPISSIICLNYLMLRLAKMNKPMIKGIIKKYRISLAFISAYLSAVCIIFSDKQVLGLIFPVFGICAYLNHFIKLKIPYSYNMIIRGTIISALIIGMLYTQDRIIANAFEDLTPFIRYEEYIGISTPCVAIAFLIDWFFSEFDGLYDSIKSYFPPVEREYIALKKKDIVISVLIFVFAIVYFIILELNKDIVHNFFIEHFSD